MMKKNYEQNLDYKKLYESFKEAYKGTGINQHYARNTTHIPSHV